MERAGNRRLARFLNRVFRLVDRHAARLRERRHRSGTRKRTWRKATAERKDPAPQDASDAEARDQGFRGALALQYFRGADHGAGERASGAGAARCRMSRRQCLKRVLSMLLI